MRSNVSWPDLLYLKSNEVKCQKWAGWDSGSVSHCGSQPPQVNIFSFHFIPFHFIVSDLGTLGIESCTCNKQMLKQQMNKWSFRKAGGSNKVWAIPLYWIRESEQMDAGRLVQSLGDPALHSLRKWTNGEHTNKQWRGSWESKTVVLCCVLSVVQCVVD